MLSLVRTTPGPSCRWGRTWGRRHSCWGRPWSPTALPLFCPYPAAAVAHTGCSDAHFAMCLQCACLRTAGMLSLNAHRHLKAQCQCRQAHEYTPCTTSCVVQLQHLDGIGHGSRAIPCLGHGMSKTREHRQHDSQNCDAARARAGGAPALAAASTERRSRSRPRRWGTGARRHCCRRTCA